MFDLNEVPDQAQAQDLSQSQVHSEDALNTESLNDNDKKQRENRNKASGAYVRPHRSFTSHEDVIFRLYESPETSVTAVA